MEGYADVRNRSVFPVEGCIRNIGDLLLNIYAGVRNRPALMEGNTDVRNRSVSPVDSLSPLRIYHHSPSSFR